MKKHLDSLIIATGLVLAAFVFGFFFFETKSKKDTVRVMGLSFLQKDADTVNWTFSIKQKVGLTQKDILKGYDLIESKRKKVLELLKNRGFKEEDFSLSVVDKYNDYSYDKIRRQSIHVGYKLSQSLTISSKKEELVSEAVNLAIKPKEFSKFGVYISSSNLAYSFSQVSEEKKKLLAQATKDAESRAQLIAHNLGRKLSKLKSLRTGNLEIYPPNSVGRNTTTRLKNLRLVVNAEFYLN